MRLALLISFFICSVSPSVSGGTRVLEFIYQPLTTLGTDQDTGIVIAKVPILAGISESLVFHIATPNRLVQDASANIEDSNILSLLGVAISVKFQHSAHYSVTLDLTRLGDTDRFGVTAEQVVAAAVECIRRTVDETRLFHFPEQRLTWELHIRSRAGEERTWKSYERTYEASSPKKP